MKRAVKKKIGVIALAAQFLLTGCGPMMARDYGARGEISTESGFAVSGDKLQLDELSIAEDRAPGRMTALIDNECLLDESPALAAEIAGDAIQDLDVQAYSFSVSSEVTLAELRRLIDDDKCVLQVSNEFDMQSTAVPNDPIFALQYQHRVLQSALAWDKFHSPTGINQDVIVAVIDSGVDYNHPDLKNNMWKNSAGHYGRDIYNNDNDPIDDHSHGTHCAGIIAASANNMTGGSGVAPFRTKIMAVKTVNAQGSGSSTHVINGINYAVENGAKVITMSLGGKGTSATLEAAIKNAVSKGVFVVSAAGNDGMAITDTNPYAPASYAKPIAGFLAVGSIDSALKKAASSNYGPSFVEIGAPGVGIQSTVLNGAYGSKSGTSMAAPMVAGASALVIGFLKSRGVNPTPALVENLLLSGSMKDSALATYFKDGNRLELKRLADLIDSRYPAPAAPPAPAPAPQPQPTPAPINGIAIAGLDLLHPETGEVIARLTDMMTIDSAKLGQRFNIRAHAAGDVESVKFDINGSYQRVDNVGKFTAVSSGALRFGTLGKIYELTVTPFSDDDAEGVAGRTVKLRLLIK